MTNNKKVDLSKVKLNEVAEATEEATEDEVINEATNEVDETLNEDEVVEETVEEKVEVKKGPSTAKKKKAKKYELHELIPCRSVTIGELGLNSQKTNNVYYWGDYGDVCEISYEDLLFLKAKKSGFIYDPMFIIEADDVFPDDSKLKEIKELYDRFVNLSDFFELPVSEIKQILANAPDGFKDLIATKAGEMVRGNRLESLAVIQIIDAIVGTNLKMFIS